MTEQKGNITITRTNSNCVPDYIVITVKVRGGEMQAKVSMAEFALALTGLAQQNCQVNVRGVLSPLPEPVSPPPPKARDFA